MKRSCFAALCLLLAVLLMGCPNPALMEDCATSRKGTEWRSEDGRIAFRVHDAPGQAVCPVFGTIETEAGAEAVAIFMTYLTTHVEVTTADDPGAQDPEIAHRCLESWTYSDVREDSFKITVTEGHYHETGEVIVFRRVGSER